MRFSETVDLIVRRETGKTQNGFPIYSETARNIFADCLSAGQKEFYLSMHAGADVTVMFVVRTCDYSGERILRHEGVYYRIVRTFSRNGETVELSCSNVGETPNGKV